jgi:hypothetical protein
MKGGMTIITTRIRIGPGGAISGRAKGLPPGEHDAQITLLDTAAVTPCREAEELLARVHAIQAEVAQLPVLDGRTPDEILAYNEHGHFD